MFEKLRVCDQTARVTFPLPLTIVDSIRMLREALTVTVTSPLVPTVPVVVVTAKGEALYTSMLPLVGLPEGSVTTWRLADTNQF